MKFSSEEFRASENKKVTLLGMSGVGKTYLSTLLCGHNWFHYSGDYRIGTRYLDEPILDIIKQQAMQVSFLRELLRRDWIYIRNNIKVDDLGSVLSFVGKLGDPEQGGVALEDFVHRQAQYVAVYRRHALQPPVLRLLPDELVDLLSMAERAFYQGPGIAEGSLRIARVLRRPKLRQHLLPLGTPYIALIEHLESHLPGLSAGAHPQATLISKNLSPFSLRQPDPTSHRAALCTAERIGSGGQLSTRWMEGCQQLGRGLGRGHGPFDDGTLELGQSLGDLGVVAKGVEKLLLDQ